MRCQVSFKLKDKPVGMQVKLTAEKCKVRDLSTSTGGNQTFVQLTNDNNMMKPDRSKLTSTTSGTSCNKDGATEQEAVFLKQVILEWS
jgi:hypothetical protein